MTPGYARDQLLTSILKELHPNGGSSLKDAVNRIEQAVISNRQLLLKVSQKQRWFSDSLGTAHFETDSDGHCIYANQAYLDFSGLSLEQVVSEGWRNVLIEEDLEAASQAWDLAVAQGRDFHRYTTYYNRRTKKVVDVSVDAYVIKDNAVVVGWMGYVVPA